MTLSFVFEEVCKGDLFYLGVVKDGYIRILCWS